MAFLKGPLVALVLTLCVACERPPTLIEVFDARINVHALLRAGEDSVRVFVSRVDTRITDQSESPLVPILNARVRMAHGADTIVLATRSHCVNTIVAFPSVSPDFNNGCYAGVIPGRVRSGERYALFVEADGQRAHGEAVVPAQPLIRSPAAGITLHYTRPHRRDLVASALVQWSGTQPDQLIDLSLRTVRRECDAIITTPNERYEFGSARISMVAVDTATIAAWDVNCPDNTQSIFPAELLLTAYDAGYSKYLMLTSATLRPEAAAVGLTEGLGVFTAAATVAVPITLVRR
jgi:hypothetical protein